MHTAEDPKHGMISAFDRAASTYGQYGPHFFVRFGQRLVELAEIPVGAHVLDVATGRGAVLFPTATQVGPHGHVTGIDLAPAMVQYTTEDIQRRALQNADVQLMDAEQLTFADATFDYVLCSFAVFFFPNLGQALAEYWRVLKPGGSIGLTTWGHDDVRWQWFTDLLKAYHRPEEQPPSEETPPTTPPLNQPDGLEAVLSQASFVDIQIAAESTDLHYATEDEWWTTLWSHGIRFYLEQLSADELASFKVETFAQLPAMKQPEGLPQCFSVLYTFGKKPADA